MENRPECYELAATIEPGAKDRFVYVPREASGGQWQFFFDEGALELELTSVTSGSEENLVQRTPAALFVFSLPCVILGRVRPISQATITLYNPTARPVAVRIWIGELAALRTELTRLQAKDPHAK